MSNADPSVRPTVSSAAIQVEVAGKTHSARWTSCGHHGFKRERPHSGGLFLTGCDYLGNLERAKGFEPSAPTLARFGTD